MGGEDILIGTGAIEVLPEDCVVALVDSFEEWEIVVVVVEEPTVCNGCSEVGGNSVAGVVVALFGRSKFCCD
jgi:hypothetical protein